MLRRLLAAAAIVCAATSVAAAAPRLLADLTGKWNVSIATPDQARTSLITWTQKGDSLAGTIESAELGSNPISGVMKGDSVFFGFKIDMGGQAIVINGVGAVKNKDSLDGLLEVGGMGSFPFSAARQP